VRELGMSSQFYSVDLGLLHLVHLDFSPWYCNFTGCEGSDNCGFTDEYTDSTGNYDFERYKMDLLAFAQRDLSGVNRTRTPWVIVSTHYPLYESSADGSPWDIKAFLLSESSEHCSQP